MAPLRLDRRIRGTLEGVSENRLYFKGPNFIVVWVSVVLRKGEAAICEGAVSPRQAAGSRSGMRADQIGCPGVTRSPVCSAAGRLIWLLGPKRSMAKNLCGSDSSSADCTLKLQDATRFAHAFTHNMMLYNVILYIYIYIKANAKLCKAWGNCS